MPRPTETGSTPASEKHPRDSSVSASEQFELAQRGKPIKAMIGVALLVVVAVLLSRMHPVPHVVPDPSVTSGQTTTGHG